MPIVGQKLPIQFQLFDNRTDLFPVAVIRNDAGTQISGSPFTLASVANGLYTTLSVDFPAGTDFVSVQYLVYSDSGHTTLSDSEGSGATSFLKETTGGGGSSNNFTTSIIGVIDGDLCQRGNIQALMIKGEKRQLNVRLVRQDDGTPYDLSDAETVTARFLNEDNTTLEITGEIVSGPLGQVTFLLSKDQTILLMQGRPAPFTIVVEFTTDDLALSNLPFQLEVADAAVGPFVS